jgi:dipeptide/tripeptide permease
MTSPSSTTTISSTGTTTTTRQSSSSILWNPVVWCILITETAERVAYFGFRALLVLWFTDGLGYSENAAIALCSGTQAIAYFSPLVGALLADGMWGRFRTILRFGGIYAVGLVLLTLSAYYSNPYNSVTETRTVSDAFDDDHDYGNHEKEDDEDTQDTNNLGMEKLLTFIGLLLTCTGTGGIKPCVSAFGANQVVMDENEQEQPASKKGLVLKAHTSGSEDEPIVSFQDENGNENENDKEDDTTTVTTIITPTREERLREFFNAFYFCINVGAVGSFAIIPVVRAKFGFGPAFLIPTVFMVFALILFWSQNHRYKNKENRSSENNGEESTLWKTFRVCGVILRERFDKNKHVKAIMNKLGKQAPQGHRLVPTTSEDVEDSCFDDNDTPKERGRQQEQEMEIYQDAAQALHVLPILFMFPIFWMLYEQQGSVWTLQATRMDLHGLQPEQLSVLNPIEIMIFIPLFDRILYPWFDSHGFNIQPLRRMQYGMFLASISFLVSGVLENYIQGQPLESVHVAWQIIQITLLAMAEILLNVTGLEFAYAQAPPNTQASILALYLLMTALGNGLGAVLYAGVFSHCNLATAMILCALAMLVNLGLFSIVAGRWKPYRREGKEEDYDDDDEVGASVVEMQTRVRSDSDD